MTGFTHADLRLVSDYSRAFFTREYKSAQQKLLMSILNLSTIAREQCTSHVARAQHVSYLQIFLRYEALLTFFVNLDMSCTVFYNTINNDYTLYGTYSTCF